MKKLLFLTFLVIFIISCNSNHKKPPMAKNGVLDLRGWDFEKDGNVRLDGQWEFYWKQFLKSADFDTVSKKHYIPVPKPWNDYMWGKEEIGYEGYATYRLRIIVNDKIKDFGLKFPDQGTAFELYLNDSLVGKNGKIGKSRETSEPQYKPLIIPFEKTGDTITLVCRVSNYDFHFGGIYFAAEVGLDQSIKKAQKINYLIDYILSAIFFVFLLILLLFFLLMPQDKISLYFIILSFFSMIRTITVNERIINEILPFLSWEWYIKLEAFSWMLEAPIFMYCMLLIFKYNHKSLKIANILLFVVFYGIALITLLTPSYINSQFIPIAQLLGGLSILSWLVIITYSISNKKENALILLFGYIPFLVSGANELMYYNNIVPLIINYPTGLLLYIFSWIVVLARRFQRAFKRVENFAKDLKIEVEEKTKDLREEKDKTDELYKKTEQLLLNVLPEQIATRLKQGETPIADHFEEASVIFIDIADFTKLSARSKPQEMVKMLNDIFTIFDKISAKYGLEKIKTIGDCYMAAAGIPIPRKDHAEAVAKMAVEAMETMRGYRVSGLGDRVSGLGDGVSGIGNDNNFRLNIGKSYEDLQRVEGIAGSDKFSGIDLQGNEIVSERGKIRVDGPDSESSGFDSGEHSRGIRQGFDEGISLSSIGSKRLSDGIGDSPDNIKQIELSQQRSIGKDMGSVRNNGEIIDRATDSTQGEAQITDHETLNPIPYPLNPIPETQRIEFRIGLDCGPIVAGVIGEQKFIYDLWGDMVNTASRMETHGIIGRIQCTERFKNKLVDSGQLSVDSNLVDSGQLSIDSKFRFEERGEIEIKGKGMMKTYFLVNSET